MANTDQQVSKGTDNPHKKSDKAESWNPLDSLRRQADRLFDEFGHGRPHLPFFRRPSQVESLLQSHTLPATMPAVDITEKDQLFEVTVEVPGMEEQDIRVKVVNGALEISGEKTEAREEKNKDYYIAERHYGSFKRSFNLPENIDVEGIEAHFGSHGVLTITLPKTAVPARPERQIPISPA
ncbi:Hsp20/alpha crystallin family protein [Stutzerimonas stutzeri]|uniref:Hsp20/alpha crystallin family protein n=1 Tax=Stutzerimonas sp. S1 TaxID=3030652 RepID=UPI0022248CC7|nr:Hsp20/alpha crystallin family protein [Stutzerimonas sp. S1]MCW3148137.1 Hsp20/alpha crystallin family protein [Stutzerimonas sp. S1]